MVDIIKVEIPSGIEYVSQITGYQLPFGHCVIDKSICGCGFTEFCIGLNNRENTILCSPRIALLDNKAEKHQGDMGLYYFQSDLLKDNFEKQYNGVIPGLKTKKSKGITKAELDRYNREKFNFMSMILRNHLRSCESMGIPCRILCTYDSFHSVKEVLGEKMAAFKVVVDEFQSIFLDAFFKADVENQFFHSLQDVPNVVYLSATPMLHEYLEKIPGFNGIPYYKFIWPESVVSTADVKEFWVSSLEDELSKIIKAYKLETASRPFKTMNGLPVFSNQVVIYANSVSLIRRLITKNKLVPSECNIIASRSDPKTRERVRSIWYADLPEGESFDIGRIPLEGEPHKKFTFCTSTAYLGADFFHTNAMTYVASDANVQSLVVDIRLDLPQILGRQRLKENPWKNECVVFYKTLSDDNVITRENFLRNVKRKKEDTMINLEDLKSMRKATFKVYLDAVEGIYKKKDLCNIENYLGVRTVKTADGQEVKEVVYNHFLEAAEERAWELSQMDYKNDISVKRSISSLNNVTLSEYTSEDNELAQKLIDTIKAIPRFDDKLKTYCEAREAAKSNPGLTSRILNYYKGVDLENLYSYFGLEGCRANMYRSGELMKILNDDIKRDSLRVELYKAFKLKEVYSLKTIKEFLKNLYASKGVNRAPKATDLLEYFEVAEKQVTDKTTKKRVSCYQLIAYK